MCLCGMCVGCGVYVVCVSVWCLCGVCESQGGVEKGLQVTRGRAGSRELRGRPRGFQAKPAGVKAEGWAPVPGKGRKE